MSDRDKEKQGAYYQKNRGKILSKLKRNYKKKSIKQKEESRKRMVEFMKGNTYGSGNKGNKLSKETKRKISKTLIGHKHSEETKRKISEAGKKRRQTEETKLKLSELRKGNKNPFYGKKHTKETLKKQSDSHKKENLSLKTRRRMSKSQKGKKLSEEHKRKIGNANKGNKLSKETKRKISEGREGEKNWMWLGGKSFEPYDKNFISSFKRKIRKRDGKICMLCSAQRNKLSRELSVHHIDYNKLNSTKENCLSLCGSCHAKTNTNRKHWTKFFQLLLKEKYGYEY